MQPIQSKRVTYTLNSTTFVVTDYSINKRYNEDELYQKQEVWKNYPRGKATVEVDGEVVYTLSGLRKYGTPDEAFGFQDFNAVKVYATVKENGECFHIGMFSFGGVVYALVGSKNVHLLIDTSQPIQPQVDLQLEQQPPRVSYACEMAQTYFELYHTVKISDYLVSTGYTLVGESINPSHAHVVVYEDKCMRFFALTCLNELYVAIPYGICIKTLESLKLPTTSTIECRLDELDQVKQSFYTRENCEGLVLYYTDTEDKVVMLYKFKAKQYTVLRTIREMYNSRCNVSKLLDRLQKYHLPLTDEEINQYRQFYERLQRTQPTEPFSTKLWDSFINDCNHKTEELSTPKLIVLSGLPGTGKTTVGGTVAYMLNLENIHAEYVDQDMFNGNKKMFLQHLFTLLYSRSRRDYIFVGRCNATVEARKECLDLSPSNNMLIHFDTSEEEVKELVDRVNSRHFHSTLKPSTRVLNVIRMFQGKWEDVQPDESNSIISLNHNLSIVEKVQMVFKALKLPEPVDVPVFQWCKFIGLKVELQDLKDLIDSDTHVKDYKVKCFDPHVTLLHYTEFHRYPKVAYKLQELISLGKVDYQVEVYDFKYSDRISAFFVGLDHKLEHKCLPSNQYHITYGKEAKVESTESKKLPNDSNAGTRYFNFRVKLNCKLQLW